MKNGIPDTDGVVAMIRCLGEQVRTFQEALDMLPVHATVYRASAVPRGLLTQDARIKITVECAGDTTWLLARDAGPYSPEPPC